MKKTMIILLFVLSIFTFAHTISASEEKNELEIYKEIVYASLYQDIDNAVSVYYSEYLTDSPNLALFSYKFIDSKHTGNHEYEITVEVLPFIGAHNSVGRDRVTIKTSPFNKAIVLKFEHLQSYETPQHLKDMFKKPLP